MTAPIGFVSGYDVVVLEEVDDTNWRVRESLVYQGSVDRFTVEAGEETDLASVPRPLTWAVPRYGRYTAAALLHDHLWRRSVPDGVLTYGDANGVLRQAMRTENVPFVTRWIIWVAVTYGACTRPGGWRALVADVPLVLLWTVLALPLIAPPTLVIAVFLAVIWLVETAAWALLNVRGGPKRVVTPTARRVWR